MCSLPHLQVVASNGIHEKRAQSRPAPLEEAECKQVEVVGEFELHLASELQRVREALASRHESEVGALRKQVEQLKQAEALLKEAQVAPPHEEAGVVWPPCSRRSGPGSQKAGKFDRENGSQLSSDYTGTSLDLLSKCEFQAENEPCHAEEYAQEETVVEPARSTPRSSFNGMWPSCNDVTRDQTGILTACTTTHSEQQIFKVRQFWAIADMPSSPKGMFRRSMQKQQSLFRVIARQAKLLRISSSSLSSHESELPYGTRLFLTMCIAHPQSKRRFLWETLGLLLVLYDLIMIPLQVFDLDMQFAQTVEILAAMFWTVDICFSFLTGTYINGELTMQPKQIAVAYLRTWFPFDIIVLLPMWMAILFERWSFSNFSVLRGLRTLRLMRLLRLAKLQRYFSELASRLNSNLIVLVIGIARSVIYLLLFNHGLACIWYSLGCQANGWVDHSLVEAADFSWMYLTAYHWSLSQLHSTMEVHPHTTRERAFAVAVLLMALVMFSSFLSSITNLMIQLQVLHQEKTRNDKAMRHYLKDRDISPQLTVRVKMYMHRLELQAEGQQRLEHQSQLLALLPGHILSDIHQEAREPLLTQHDLMKEISIDYPRALRMICHEAVEESQVQSEDIIFTKGDACNRMLFLERGAYRYTTAKASEAQRARKMRNSRRISLTMSEDGRHLTTKLYRGSWLSEAALWTEWENVGELRALAHGSFLILQMTLFGEVAKRYARAYRDLSLYADGFVQHITICGCNDLGPMEPLQRNEHVIQDVELRTRHEAQSTAF